jgi:hypothetical protein
VLWHLEIQTSSLDLWRGEQTSGGQLNITSRLALLSSDVPDISNFYSNHTRNRFAVFELLNTTDST